MDNKKMHNCKIVPEFECQGQSQCEYKTEHNENTEWCGKNHEGYCLDREVQQKTFTDFMKVNIESAERNGIKL